METEKRKFINWKLVTKIGPYISFVCVLYGLILHVVGVSTNSWLKGSQMDAAEDKTDIVRVSIGLWRQRIEYRNWTVEETDSALTNQVPQAVILTIACISAVLSSVTLVKGIHIVVGTSGFISMPLLIVSLVLIQSDMEINRVKVQTGRITWPPVSVSWSFYLVFAGLLINTVFTGFFSNLATAEKRFGG